ncbi:MAG: hypothetical protein N2039_05480, partial [Gemmataceae bacterium]|nr:hypothetical protein [Gemmataceae bacterium]
MRKAVFHATSRCVPGSVVLRRFPADVGNGDEPPLARVTGPPGECGLPAVTLPAAASHRTRLP